HKLLHTLPAIRAQITGADTALISKADRYPEAEIARTRAAVQAIQPTIRCVSMIQGEADIRVWDEIACPVVEGDYAKCVDPDYFRFVLSDPLPESCARFRGLAEASGEALYRAKGFLREGDRVYAVEWSSSGFRAEEWTGPLPPLGIACIARGEDGARLEALWRTTRNKAGVPTADES
ncbi:MAG: hypothetical protein U1E27_14610, partial [Kiritimatiellia bacterium]|nr:hypothetical protein [Kiritimatiellia bacterium]